MLLYLTVSVIFYGFYSVNCAIINSPANHHTNNIIHKDTKNATVLEIPIDEHAEIIAIRPERNESEENKRETSKLIKPTKMFQHKKVLTTIIHPLPKTMHDLMPHEAIHPSQVDHKRFHDDFLKHEGPKLQKKLHHHYTIEEMRQRRKELKEKWQARHDKHEQYGEYKKRKHHADHMEHPVHKTQELEEQGKHIGRLYEQITPRTGEHLKHEEHSRKLENINTSPQNSEIDTPRHISGSKYVKRSIETGQKPQPQWHRKEEANPSALDNTDSKQRFAVIGGVPALDALELMDKLHQQEFAKRINQTSEPETKNSRNEEREMFQRAVVPRTTTETPGPVPDDVVSVRIDTSNAIPEIKAFGAPLQRPFFLTGKSAEQIGGIQDERSERVAGIDIHPGLENEQVTIRIDTPPYYRNLTYEEKILIQRPLWGAGKSAEEENNQRSERVAGIDIHPGLENEQVTIRIDTPPYYRNLTYDEKILIQRPLWGAGKSAEEDNNERSERVAGIDIHPGLENEQVTIRIDTPPFYRNLTYEEKILIQRPLWGAGKSAEEDNNERSERVAGIDIHPGLENEQVTIRIDTPPFYRNLTYEEKILIQRPLWGAGKSAEEENNERSERVAGIDIHPGLENEQVTIRIDTPPYYRNLTYEEKILIQRPLWGSGKSAEEFDAEK